VIEGRFPRSIDVLHILLAKYAEFKEKLNYEEDSADPGLVYVAFLDYIDRGDPAIEAGYAMLERRKVLTAKLHEHGLALRRDSRLCREFIQHSTDLDEVVRMMREMHFFYTQTNYAQVYKRLLNQEYKQAKRDLRDICGYIDDPKEYRRLLRKNIDYDGISVQAKWEVLSGLDGSNVVVPDFVHAATV
jgi:hypothetical protein